MTGHEIRGGVTEKIYYADSYISSFDAHVLSCEKAGGRWAVVLDRTAFFPEGGGQSADTGVLEDAAVLDVQAEKGVLVHYTDRPLEQGRTVNGSINWEQRFRRMQNHTGEHILCGIAHRMYGYENVGFHLGEKDVTFDLSGELDKAQLCELEQLANRVVAQNVRVKAECCSEKELAGMEYRSKLELTDDIRIVTIENCDRCACCAPHVGRTGEIGIIKLLDSMRYKGGMRIHMLCGFDALDDYNVKYNNILKISALLSAPQERTAEYVERVLGELQAQKHNVFELNRQLVTAKLSAISQTEGNICFFEPTFGTEELRALVNGTVPLCGGVCAAFSGNDGDGYSYVMGSANVPMREACKKINAALNGKGGGTDAMVQGSVKAVRSEIEKLFAAGIL